MIAEAIDVILRDQCTPAAVRTIEGGGSPDSLWDAIAGAGFLDLLRAEEEGGAGLPLPELYPVVSLLGRYAVPLPVAQSIGARALVVPGMRLPPEMITLAPALRRELDGSLCCPFVPYGAIAEYVMAPEGDGVLLLPCASARRYGTGIAHSQVATLVWNSAGHAERISDEGSALTVLAAALHAALLAGAMARVFEMTLQYCNERSQFGKSLGKFQVVQHQLSVMAEQVAAGAMAAESAFQTTGRTPRLISAAIAKARASEAAAGAANTAHALHGAIGVTEEYDLQLFTRRLHEWRVAHGSESYWNRLVGEQVIASTGTVAEFVRG